MSSSSIGDEREKFLRILEEDKEFRYAVMGLLGYTELVERLTRLEEIARRNEKRIAEIEREVAKINERIARVEGRITKLEERVAKLEEKIARLEERVAKLEERITKLEERVAKLEEKIVRLENRMDRFELLLNTVAHRFGVITEHAFRDALRGIIEQYFGGRVSKTNLYDEKGIVFGHPAMIDIDVVIRDGYHIVVEVKSRVDRSDVAEAYRVGLLYEEKNGVRPRVVIVGGEVRRSARELAEKLGVEIYGYLGKLGETD